MTSFADSLSGSPVISEEKDRNWSSIPVLALWVIKDKLDIFDNKRFEAVCRDWRSASNQYPKVLQTVGDGLPWISWAEGYRSSSWELTSVARGCKFEVDMPEWAEHQVVSSKRGWILMRGSKKMPESVFLVNPFTKAKIVLPPGPKNRGYRGCITTDDDEGGYPQCVFLLMFLDGHSKALIKTVRPGVDKEWTDHVFLGRPPEREGGSFAYNPYIITIRQYVYWFDARFRVMAFNLADHSWEELPQLPSTCTKPDGSEAAAKGFITEHEGGLIFIQHVFDPEPRNTNSSGYTFTSCFNLYRYNRDSSSWTRMNNNNYGGGEEVKDTTWFHSLDCGCCVATTTTKKGGGLKIYHLSQDYYLLAAKDPNSIRVEVYDLLTGDRQFLPLPFQFNCLACWVDIG